MSLRTIPLPPYNGLTSSFLNGGGMFSIPAGGGAPGSGTVTSVALGAPQEFTVSGSPITAAGTLDFQFASPLLVAHGGTGAGTLGSNAIVATGLTSSAAFTAILLNQMTSSFLNGNGAFSFIPAGGAGAADSWTSLTAGSGLSSTSNGDSTISYAVAQTTNSRISWRFRESAAGVSTGTPVLVQIDTLAASTAIPLLVSSRGTEVFRISPSAVQILAADGSGTGTPPYSFATSSTTGMRNNGSTGVILQSGGTIALQTSTTQVSILAGAANLPGLTDRTAADSGLFWPSSGVLGVSTAAIENSRFIANAWQPSRGLGNALGYAINARKARGTVASPTVITTGDDLLTVGGFGYVGATNTYLQAAAIRYGSTSTVTDSANGLGGVIDVRAQLSGSGTSTLPTIFRFSGTTKHAVSMGTVPAITSDGGTSPSLVGTDHSFTITVGSGGIATTVTVTFGRPWTKVPQCVANHQGAILALRCVPTLTTVVIDAATAFTAGGLIDVICSGYED